MKKHSKWDLIFFAFSRSLHSPLTWIQIINIFAASECAIKRCTKDENRADMHGYVTYWIESGT